MSTKENKNVTETAEKLTDAQLDYLAKAAGEEIKKLPKVKIRIPKDPLNPKDEVVPVCINGYIWQIKRGETVEVPKPVADILADAGYI